MAAMAAPSFSSSSTSPWSNPHTLHRSKSVNSHKHSPLLRLPSTPFRRSIRARVHCWLSQPHRPQDDELGGWLVGIPERENVDGLVIIGVSAAAAVLWIAFSIAARRGFKHIFDDSFRIFHQKINTFIAESPSKDSTGKTLEDEVTALEKPDVAAGGQKENLPSGMRKLVVFSDPTHEEALAILKNLQIIESDVKPDELCTRREFARWFVNVSSKLERRRNHKIVPDLLIAGPIIQAFDDVNVDDPDFLSIQSLAEAGIVQSKLSVNSSFPSRGTSDGHEYSKFLPESYLSRLDLVNWKTIVEYPTASKTDQKMSNKRAVLRDLTACRDLQSSLAVDLLAGEQSIVRRVFGNTRRLQPRKPVTNAQAAFLLSCGRTEVISDEVAKLEVENLSRLSAVREIRAELLDKDIIRSCWNDKLQKERDQVATAKRSYEAVLSDLEKERETRRDNLSAYVVAKAALEGQQQLLQSLQLEVDEMHDRIAAERADLIALRENLEKTSSDVSIKLNTIIEAKLVLEAEREALQMLRSWVEEEAMRISSRTQRLEQVVKRWRCVD